MIQLTKAGLTGVSDLDSFIQEFAQRYSFRLPQLLHPELIQIVTHRMELGNWISREHGAIGRELCLEDDVAFQLLHFVANTPEFLALVQQVTQCGQISRFDGRVYRMAPGKEHYDSWHTDATTDRLVGMSINLSSRSYAGGAFCLRIRHSDDIICELPNVVIGDAIFFRISSELVHMVTPVEGTQHKTAFAGWFKSGGRNFFSAVRRTP